MLSAISELEEVIDEEQAPTMTEEQSEEDRRGLERAVLATQQELYRRAQAAAREGRETSGRGTPLANVSASSSSGAQASEIVSFPMQPPPAPPPMGGKGKGRSEMEATPASTPRTPLTTFEDWQPPPCFVSIGTDTTSSEMVVLPVDAPSSVGDNPPKAALPFEPVQPTQQRLAMQASPQTS